MPLRILPRPHRILTPLKSRHLNLLARPTTTPTLSSIFSNYGQKLAYSSTTKLSAKPYRLPQLNQSKGELPVDAMATTKTGEPLDRTNFDIILRRRLFYTPSFEIYGGVSGLYDYGPPGCALQANIIDIWRKHFVLEEDMLEVDCTMLTPYEVLKTSGHVDRFSDFMCKDPKTGAHHRADHLVEKVLEARLEADKEARAAEAGADDKDAHLKAAQEAKAAEDKKKKKKHVKDLKALKLSDETVKEYNEILAKIDNYDGNDLGALIVKHEILSPEGNAVEAPVPFNLMFGTSIGPSSNLPGYLRPETAQGQFLNFSKLLEFNNLRMPFASASIGKSFRNEISPRQGLLRVREFLMAEIEHYVDPENKRHPNFKAVEDIKLKFLPKDVQESGKTDLIEKTVGEAVSSGMVDNETLGYFLARIALFLKKIGIDENKIRFRQHMANEMAHYASDCWDAELHSSYGWIECVGCADRSAYDLSVHSKKTNTDLSVSETLPEPKRYETWEAEINKSKFGPKFKKDAKAVTEAILALDQAQLEAYAKELEAGSFKINVPSLGEVELDTDLLKIAKVQKVEHTRTYVPNVIEPSFGIGRILAILMEHSFWTRPEDALRGVLSFPPVVAPTKALIVPLSSNPVFNPLIQELMKKMRIAGISNRVDASSATIGKRYARNDELGTPFGVTVDFQSVKDNTVTLRDRDTMKQVRGTLDEVVEAIKNVVNGVETWDDIKGRLKVFESQELEE